VSEEDDMLISDVARELNLSHVTVWRHLKAGNLACRKVGPIYLIKRKSFEAFRRRDRKPGRPRRPAPSPPDRP
jgi:predicted ArsR family transcriptional regulator